jgi:hypothetical protein
MTAVTDRLGAFGLRLLNFELLMEHHALQSRLDSLIDVPFTARSSIIADLAVLTVHQIY